MRKDSEKLKNLNFDTLTDAEIENLYGSRATNSSKSLAPLFIYLILKHQPEGVHLTQKEIARKLEERYELKLERKALNRILHSLDDANVGIISTSDAGSWYEAL